MKWPRVILRTVFIGCCAVFLSCRQQAECASEESDRDSTNQAAQDTKSSTSSTKSSSHTTSEILKPSQIRNRRMSSLPNSEEFSDNNAGLNSAFLYSDQIMRNLLKNQSPKQLNYARSNFFLNLLKPRTTRFHTWDDHSLMHFGKRSMDNGEEKILEKRSAEPISSDNILQFERDSGKNIDEGNNEPNVLTLEFPNFGTEIEEEFSTKEANKQLPEEIDTRQTVYKVAEFDKKSGDPWHNVMSFGKKSENPWDHNTLHFGKREDPWHNVMSFGKRFENNWDHNTMHFGKRSDPWHNVMSFGKKSDPWHNVMSFGKRSDPWHNVMSFGKKADPWHNVMSFGKKSDNPWDHNTLHFGKRGDPWHNVMSFGKKSDEVWDHNTLHFGKKDEPWHNVMSFGKKDEPWHNVMSFGKKSDISGTNYTEEKRGDPWHSMMSFGKKFDENFGDHFNVHFGKRGEPWHNMMSFGKKSDEPFEEYSTLQLEKRNDPWHSMMSFGKRGAGMTYDDQGDFGLEFNPWEGSDSIEFNKKSDTWDHNTLHFGKRQNSNSVSKLSAQVSQKENLKHIQKRSVESWDTHNTMHFGKRSETDDVENISNDDKKSDWDMHNTLHFGKKRDPWENHNTMHFGKREPWDYHNTMHFGKRDPWDYHSTMHFGKRDPWDDHNTMHFGKRDPWDSHNTMHFGKRSNFENLNDGHENMNIQDNSQVKMKENYPNEQLVKANPKKEEEPTFDTIRTKDTKARIRKRSIERNSQKGNKEKSENEESHDKMSDYTKEEIPETVLHFGKRSVNDIEQNNKENAQQYLHIEDKRFEDPWDNHNTMHFGKRDPWDHSTMHFGKRDPWDHSTMHFGKRDPWDHSTMHFGKRDPWDHSTMHFGKRNSWDHNTMHFGKREPWDHSTMHFGKRDPWDHSTMHFGKRVPWDHSTMHFGKRDPWDHSTMHFGKRNPWDHNTMHFGKREEFEDDDIEVNSNEPLQDYDSLIKLLKENGAENLNEIEFPFDTNDQENNLAYLEMILRDSSIPAKSKLFILKNYLRPILKHILSDDDAEIMMLDGRLPDSEEYFDETSDPNGEDNSVVNYEYFKNPENSLIKPGMNSVNYVDNIFSPMTNEEGNDGIYSNSDWGPLLKDKTKRNYIGKSDFKRYFAPFQGPKSFVYPHAWFASQIRRSASPKSIDFSRGFEVRTAEKKEDPFNSYMHFGRR